MNSEMMRLIKEKDALIAECANLERMLNLAIERHNLICDSRDSLSVELLRSEIKSVTPPAGPDELMKRSGDGEYRDWREVWNESEKGREAMREARRKSV